MGATNAAFGKDDTDQTAEFTAPSVYLDLRTTYATAPGGAIGIGFGNTSLFSVLGAIALAAGHTPSTVPTHIKLPTVHAVTVDIPLTVDLNDRVSVYGGVSVNANTMPLGGWTDIDIASWNVGFQADLYKQNGGALPSVTVQSTITQSLPFGPFATTNFNNVIEFDYALDEDQTRGFLLGFQDTRVAVQSASADVRPGMIGYAGGYYQWSNNWKASARVGMQSFGGVELLNRTLIQPFTQPVLRLDLDRMDDNDNRLFGVMVQVQWIPQPSYQLTFRTPLYLTQN
ncbi:hypothetical protein [Tardiphaga sp. 768_D3_N2_1]|uniref:hypothetical protein n=1 Tax=Tardiphaga sp. 768_D3_N2_1 TaxID=3240783 RepID=UPI003F8C07D9